MQSKTEAVAAGPDSEGVQQTVAHPESPRVHEYFDLRDALREPGCPACTRVVRTGQEALEGMAEDASSTTPGRKTRLGLRTLCDIHARSLHQVSEKRIGPAEAYEVYLRARIGALQRAARRLGRDSQGWWTRWLRAWGVSGGMGRWPLRGRWRCPACLAAQAVEWRDLLLFPDLITDMEFVRAYEASSGLCLPHQDLILRVVPDHPNLPRLLEMQVSKAKQLQADLQDFIRRVKAPFGGPTRGEQSDIWNRVLEWTAGKPGVFGPERDLTRASAIREVCWGEIARTAVRRIPARVVEEGSTGRMDDVERLSLENAKLQRRLVEVSREWAEESARRAALQYQVHKLSEDVKVLELNLAGARGEARAGDIQAERLRAEIQALREDLHRHRGEQRDAPNASGDG